MKTLKKLETKAVLKTGWIKGGDGEDLPSDDTEMIQARERRVTFTLL
jgi:hypothetical protein